MFCAETGFIKLRSMVTGEYDFVRYDQIKAITSVVISTCYGDKPPKHFAIQDATEWTNVGFGGDGGIRSILHVCEKPAEIHMAIMACRAHDESRKSQRLSDLSQLVKAIPIENHAS